MKIYSFIVRDSSNASYLGKDFSQIIDETFIESRRHIRFIDLKETGKKLTVYFVFNTTSKQTIKIVFDIKSFREVNISMDVGEKAIRVSNKMRKFDHETVKHYFSLLDRVFNVIFSKVGTTSLRVEDNSKFIKVIDKVNSVVLY